MIRELVKILSKAINKKMEFEKENWLKKNQVSKIQEVYKDFYVSDEKRLFALAACIKSFTSTTYTKSSFWTQK